MLSPHPSPSSCRDCAATESVYLCEKDCMCRMEHIAPGAYFFNLETPIRIGVGNSVNYKAKKRLKVTMWTICPAKNEKMAMRLLELLHVGKPI
ncbi:hypothetical protein Y032_0514g2777 [Ancylostoma ceylanicum]|uniref:Uncharacterized protein n=1 Tax=Ancylostoma ceylanicum TaxID=53326 RepID=A0A016WT92_9BILA|nr:hypothetical protein Y032_0514g2777 [Ancylostoma ceylanicum]